MDKGCTEKRNLPLRVVLGTNGKVIKDRLVSAGVPQKGSNTDLVFVLVKEPMPTSIDTINYVESKGARCDKVDALLTLIGMVRAIVYAEETTCERFALENKIGNEPDSMVKERVILLPNPVGEKGSSDFKVDLLRHD